LTFIQQEDEFFDIDKSQYGLVPVRCEVWEGFVFVNLDRGRLAPGLLADVTAVPGDPLSDIGVTQKVGFVAKGVGSMSTTRSTTDDIVEIQQLLARYAVTITQQDIDGLLEGFTPDGTYSAFGETYSLERLPAQVEAAPKGLFMTATPVIDWRAAPQRAPSRYVSSTTPLTTCGSATTMTPTRARPTVGG
jgi:hypothetical protein